MKAPVIVWRESVYKNDFKCSCGFPLMTEEGTINRDVLYNPHDKILICPKCQKVVAKLKGEMEVAEGETMMKGKWEEA